jgi:AMP-polyphosphate phosphotransferase
VLTDSGVRLIKLFLHITPDEQVRRFRDRIINPLKRWKLSYEDFRNRDRRSDYVVAIEDMLEETSTKFAPWYLIPANDKPFGRIAAFRVIADHSEKACLLAFDDHGFERAANDAAGLCWRLFMFVFRRFCMAQCS